MPKPSKGKKEARYLSHNELEKFLTAATGAYLEGLFLLMINTGLRPGEALGLSWDKRARLTVRQALVETNGQVSIGPVKTNESKRTTTLPAVAVDALKRQRTKQKRERLAAGEGWTNEHNLVFTHPQGGWLRRSYVGHTPLGAVLSKAELKDVTLHTFRHTHASLLLDQGVPIKAVSQRLGHANVTTTLETYAHVMAGQDERTARVMDKYMGAIQPSSQ